MSEDLKARDRKLTVMGEGRAGRGGDGVCTSTVDCGIFDPHGIDMPKPATKRSVRIGVRTDPEGKAVIERAALLRHTSVSAYLLSSALEKAKAELSEIETVSLRDTDRDAFFAALESPPEPDAALRKLLAEGRRPKA